MTGISRLTLLGVFRLATPGRHSAAAFEEISQPVDLPLCQGLAAYSSPSLFLPYEIQGIFVKYT